MKPSAILIATALIFASAPAIAKPSFSVNEKKLMKSAQTAANGRIKRLNKTCNLNMKISFDWDSFNRADAITSSVASACIGQVVLIKYLCQRDEYAQSVLRKSLKEIRCTNADKGKESHQLVGTTLIESYSIDGDFYKTQDTPPLQKWLGDNL